MQQVMHERLQGARLYTEVQAGGIRLPACAHRYMFQLSALTDLVKGPASLKPSVKVVDGLAYLQCHISDVTTIPGVAETCSRRLLHVASALVFLATQLCAACCHCMNESGRVGFRLEATDQPSGALSAAHKHPVRAGARCVAIESTSKARASPPQGQPRGASGVGDDPSWLVDLVPLLRGQDNAYFSRKHIMSLSAEQAPLVVKHRASASQGLSYVLLAADSAVSLKAAALLRALLRDQDKLVVAHFVRQHAQVKPALEGFLRQYQARP